MSNALKIRANEMVIDLTEPSGSKSDTKLIVNINTFEIVGKIEPPLMQPVYKEGYNG